MKQRPLILFALSLLVLAGIGGIFYPLLSNYLYESRQDTIITEYAETLEQADTEALAAALEEAQSYNERLRTGTAILTDPFDPEQYQVDDAEYNSLLNLNDDGIMGYIEIPSIDVNLPIYHGTSEAVLSQGVGHLENSSLPVGGAGTHGVLSGHTGLSNKRLFTDLSQLQAGDYFYLSVLGQRLTYQVDEINVVLPHQTEYLQIQEGQDYVTLLTCTPYGINSHRLLVRGVRVETPTEGLSVEAEAADEPTHSSQWTREYLKSVLIGGGCVAVTLAALMGVPKLIAKRRGERT